MCSCPGVASVCLGLGLRVEGGGSPTDRWLMTTVALTPHYNHCRYSASEAVHLIVQYSVTALIAVPTMMEDLVHALVVVRPAAPSAAAAAHAESLPSVQRVLVGGGGMRPQLTPLVRSVLPHAVISSAYGMTEAASSITFLVPATGFDLPPAGQQRQQPTAAVLAAGSSSNRSSDRSSSSSTSDSSRNPGGVCVGAPGPGVQVVIRSTAEAVASNGSGGGAPGVGEVLTRGPHVMSGYWRDAAQTARALSRDGWLHTGDLGWLDTRGQLWLLGRSKDVVKSGGENVHAREVEGVLESHPAVLAAAVVGLPHTRLGEMVR